MSSKSYIEWIKMIKERYPQYQLHGQILLDTSYHPDFVDGMHGYIRTDDDWYPSFKGGYVAFCMIPVCHLSKVPFARFMGADDSDMGREFATDGEMLEFFDRLPPVVNKDWLESQGFIHGY